MKRISEMSDTEILKISLDDVETLYKRELMEEGVQFPVQPIESEYEESPKFDTVYYEIPALSVKFVNREEADLVSKALQEVKLSGLVKVSSNYYSGTSEEYYLERFDNSYEYQEGACFSVVKKKAYSAELYSKVKDVLVKNGKVKSEYTRHKEKYDEVNIQASEIKDRVYNAYYGVINKYNDYKKHCEAFAEYLSLADKQYTKAMQFFKKTYNIDEEEEKYIKNYFDVDINKPQEAPKST
jgi:hypothetical protein